MRDHYFPLCIEHAIQFALAYVYIYIVSGHKLQVPCIILLDAPTSPIWFQRESRNDKVLLLARMAAKASAPLELIQLLRKSREVHSLLACNASVTASRPKPKSPTEFQCNDKDWMVLLACNNVPRAWCRLCRILLPHSSKVWTRGLHSRTAKTKLQQSSPIKQSLKSKAVNPLSLFNAWQMASSSLE